MAQSSNTPWTDKELRAAVEGYLYLLRLELSGVPCREGAADKVLLAGPLKNRNSASIRYRMRNISAVVQELDGPILAAYSAAEQVGAGVRPRIRKLIEAHPVFRDIKATNSTFGSANVSGAVDKSVVLEKLAALRGQIEAFEKQLAGIGHNHPPETIDPDTPSIADVSLAKADIDSLVTEVSKPAADPQAAKAHSRGLLDFGLKIALWVGQRATKFIDAALYAVAPIAVAQATGILPNIIDVAKNVGKLIGQP